MTKKNPAKETSPDDFPETPPPRDLYPTSDIRFVLVEIGKLSSTLVDMGKKVDKQGDKLSDIEHKLTFLKGASWAIGIMIPLFASLLYFLLSSKWDGAVSVLRAALHAH